MEKACHNYTVDLCLREEPPMNLPFTILSGAITSLIQHCDYYFIFSPNFMSTILSHCCNFWGFLVTQLPIFSLWEYHFSPLDSLRLLLASISKHIGGGSMVLPLIYSFDAFWGRREERGHEDVRNQGNPIENSTISDGVCLILPLTYSRAEIDILISARGQRQLIDPLCDLLLPWDDLQRSLCYMGPVSNAPYSLQSKLCSYSVYTLWAVDKNSALCIVNRVPFGMHMFSQYSSWLGFRTAPFIIVFKTPTWQVTKICRCT